MITFKKIYEFIFSSFRIGGASHFLDELEGEQVKELIIIKRSWIYGFFISLLFIIIIGLTGVNIYYIIINYTSTPLLYLVGIIIIANVIFGVFSGISYIYRFRKIHKRESNLTGIHDIVSIRQSLREEDSAFAQFFNHITLSYYLFIGITLFDFYYLIFMRGDYMTLSAMSGSFFLIVQIVIIAFYRRWMIDLEMDYIIVIPNRLYFVDQIGVYERSQSIKWVTNIRLITSSYPNFLGSLFNYGTIEVIVKNDTPAIAGTYHMRYVNNPIEIVNQINKLIEKESTQA